MDMVYDEYLDMYEDVEEHSLSRIKRKIKDYNGDSSYIPHSTTNHSNSTELYDFSSSSNDSSTSDSIIDSSFDGGGGGFGGGGASGDY